MSNEYLRGRIDPIPALKRQLRQALAEVLNGGNADDVASVIGTDRPRVSELRRGKLTRLSIETLIRYLERLDHRVDINVTHVRPNYRPSPAGSGPFSTAQCTERRDAQND